MGRVIITLDDGVTVINIDTPSLREAEQRAVQILTSRFVESDIPNGVVFYAITDVVRVETVEIVPPNPTTSI